MGAHTQPIRVARPPPRGGPYDAAGAACCPIGAPIGAPVGIAIGGYPGGGKFGGGGAPYVAGDGAVAGGAAVAGAGAPPPWVAAFAEAPFGCTFGCSIEHLSPNLQPRPVKKYGHTLSSPFFTELVKPRCCRCWGPLPLPLVEPVSRRFELGGCGHCGRW